ncbi:hypothetical protein [Herminiimonas arsenitoxidans]|uniref:hypothetical protein n=1 Tax=Herminiimonas arsenitoxidans TaxID=1809410 RepID=UPI0012FFB1CD|nr:hypothetical protein [Herminiimonas arsenitoxidans]
MNKFITPLIAISLLAGCASTNTGTNRSSGGKTDVEVCMTAIKHSNLLIVEVPATGSFISNKMIVATVKATGSNAVDSLVSVLSLSARHAVVVVGDNDEVTAATVETALGKLPQATVRSKEPLCFAGDAQFEPGLRAAADAARISFLAVPNR